MIITSSRRLGALALATTIAVGACSGSSSPSPAASQAVAGPAVPSGDVSLAGAGATFPGPLYQVWVEKFAAAHPNIRIDYQAIGSGGGIKNITARTVDFGASDAAMKDAEIAALPAGTKILHIPTALGAVVFIYNLAGVAELNLDGPTAAEIFLGSITKWNDPKIAALNSGVVLPVTDIVVIHRSDGSGTTNAFTTYLGAVSDAWKNGPGVGKDVNWPIGIGAKGNDGVAGGVKQTPGAIGYVELNYATQAALATAKLKNADGAFVSASVDGVTAAADASVASFPADFRADPIINGAGAATYPIAAYTYLLVYAEQADQAKGRALVSFVSWALTDGQADEAGLGYAPLPRAVQDKALAELHTITSGGNPIWP